MDNHDFIREMQELTKIGQDECQRPISMTTPQQVFEVARPDVSESTQLFTEMIGESPDSFLRSVKNAYREKATVDELARLDKATDLTSPDVLRKSGRPSRLPPGIEGQCLLCHKDFKTVKELQIHDAENLELHRLLL